ncbi:hypothetical protein BLOT_011694 [Blomia tropicalis]|nr:hypothetical protein BLOT_011694 [Blomia tropicalis]
MSNTDRRMASNMFRFVANFFSNSHAVMHQLDSDYGTIRRRTCLSNFESNFRTAYYTFLFVAFYLIPLSLIAFTSFCIARSLLRTSVLRRQGSLLRQEVNRRKVGKMILIVVLTFTIAWTPYFLVSIVTQYMSENFMEKHNFYFTMLCINLFAFLHSSINPLIYATMSTRFRKGFARIIRILLCCSSGTPSTNIGNQNSFNEQVTSSRGSIVNGMM